MLLGLVSKTQLMRDLLMNDAPIVRQAARQIGPMLTQIEAWQPPTLQYEGLKIAMVGSLTYGIPLEEVDYADPDLPVSDYTGESYRQAKIDRLTDDISCAQESRTASLFEAENSTAWLHELNGSLADWQPVEVPTRQLP